MSSLLAVSVTGKGHPVYFHNRTDGNSNAFLASIESAIQ